MQFNTGYPVVKRLPAKRVAKIRVPAVGKSAVITRSLQLNDMDQCDLMFVGPVTQYREIQLAPETKTRKLLL